MWLEQITTAVARGDVILWLCSLIAAGLIGWLIARYVGSKAALSWECRQIETGGAPSDDRLKIVYDGQPVDRACVSEIRLVNTGNRVIREEPGLDSPLRVSAPPGARLLRAEAVEQTSEGVGAECRRTSETAAEVHFRALKPGEHILIALLHDGSCEEQPTLQGRLAEVAVTRAGAYGSWALMAVAAGAVVIAVLAGGIDLAAFWQSPGPDRWYRLTCGLGMLAAALLALSGLIYLARYKGPLSSS
jgi:hypothetical protein